MFTSNEIAPQRKSNLSESLDLRLLDTVVEKRRTLQKVAYTTRDAREFRRSSYHLVPMNRGS